MSLILAVAIVMASVTSAFVVLMLLDLVRRPRGRRGAGVSILPEVEPTIFLFDDRDLVDATSPATSLVDGLPSVGTVWDRLVCYISARLPDFAEAMSTLAERGTIRLSSASHPDFGLTAEYVGGLARLTLTDLSREGQGIVVDSLSHRAREQEVTALRDALSLAPVPTWRTDRSGAVTWANTAYLALADRSQDGQGLTWPLPRLFDTAEGRGRQRPQGGEGWYDVQSIPCEDDLLNYAFPADAVVRAESSLREFIQTLAKTFAELPIGLAVFDRQRQLALFNPALVDLTSLSGAFLSGRPTLFAFLDQLREARIVPEPKDYANWRRRMSELEKAAASGQYEETWTLPSGLTYKVTGRPHPDGAVAFLFEDISAEMSLTRRFRAEIELGQAVIDAMDEAIAVFSDSGELTMSNRAYARLWGIDPVATLGRVTIVDATRHWQAMTRPTSAWSDFRDIAGEPGAEPAWECRAALKDDRPILCRATRMARGAVLVRFSPLAEAPAQEVVAAPQPMALPRRDSVPA